MAPKRSRYREYSVVNEEDRNLGRSDNVEIENISYKGEQLVRFGPRNDWERTEGDLCCALETKIEDKLTSQD